MDAEKAIHPLLVPFLERRGLVVLDGALATELERRGADLRDPLWSARVLLDEPALIRQVHLDYFRAGADVATTASYQASLPGLARRGLDAKQAADVLRRSVQLAREARDAFRADHPNRVNPLVAASVGCYGAFLHDGSEYRGNYGLTVRQLMDWHRPRLEILADAGADLLACETIPTLVEVEALVRLLEEYPGVPTWLSVSCRDEHRLRHGEPVAEAAALADASANVLAFGVNCTPPRFVLGLLESARRGTNKPLVAYPNSGESWDASGQQWCPSAHEVNWAEAVHAWRRAGALLIGGCCRTTPATIEKLTTEAPRHREEKKREK